MEITIAKAVVILLIVTVFIWVRDVKPPSDPFN